MRGMLIICALLLLSGIVTAQDQDDTEATTDTGPTVVTGQLNDAQYFVEVPIEITQRGTTIVADASVTSGNLDTLLLLVNENGLIVGENDDRAPDDLTSLLVYPAAQRGNYTLVITRFALQDGDSSGEFSVSIAQTTDTDPAQSLSYALSEGDLQAAGYPATQTRAEATWTVLVYLAADGTLENSLLADFEELERAGGSTEAVRVVALLDRHPEFAATPDDWSGTRIYEVQPNETDAIDSSPLADLGEVNTASGETLAQFLNWGVRNFPAQRYVIALGGQGASWRGSMTDATTNPDADTTISTAGMAQAFQAAARAAGVERFDLLVQDSDLMSSIEYFARIHPYFDYAIASADILIDPAIDLSRLIETLQTSPDPIDTQALSRSLVDVYIERDVIGSGASDGTFLSSTVTDLRAFAGLIDSVEAFASVALSAQTRYLPLVANARQFAYTFTEFLGEDERINLKNFMTLIASISQNNALRGAAVDVLNALEGVFVYGRGGRLVTALDAYYGIYFPEDILDFDVAYFEASPLLEWDAMLRAFFNDQQARFWQPDLRN